MRNAMRYRARPTVEQQRAAIEPMTAGARLLAFYKQNGTPRRPLTPRQQRRIRKVAHRRLTNA